MQVLVCFATAHGSTETIARRIADRIRDAGATVEVRTLESVAAFEGFDAVVAGSAVHDGRWLPSAAEKLLEHTRVLQERPVWLFSVSTLGETSSAFGPRLARALTSARSDSKELVRLRGAIHPRGHRHFAGVIRREDWGVAGHLFLRLVGGRYGDHRDIEDIDTWANDIARALVARESIASGARPTV